MKKIIILAIIWSLVCTTIHTPPPMLKRSANSCWTSVGIWLLYNIPDLVNDLIDNENTYKNNKDLVLIINLLKAMRAREEAGEETNSNKKQINDLNNQLEKARIDFYHNIACPLVNVKPGDAADAQDFFEALVKLLPAGKKIIGSQTPLPLGNDFGISYDNAKEYIFVNYKPYFTNFLKKTKNPIK